MTGLRAARLQAGYPTAKAAYVAFSKGRKGREALSLAYFVQLESRGPALLSEPTGRRLAHLYNCSMNLVFAWSIEANNGKDTAELPGSASDDTSGGDISPRNPARNRAVAQRQPCAKTTENNPPTKNKGLAENPASPWKATTTMMILPRSSGGSL